MSFSTPKILSSTDNWGAFVLFAGFCFLAILYVFFLVPETTGIGVEQIDMIFEGPWIVGHRRKGQPELSENVQSIREEIIKC